MKADLYKTNGSSPPCTAIVNVVGQTAAILPDPRQTVAASLEDPDIMATIQRGARKANIKKYSAVVTNPRHGFICEHISDVVQATCVALLEHHAEEYTGLTPEKRPQFLEQLATRTAWHNVYLMKREVPLAEPIDSDPVTSEGPCIFACDDISLNGRRRHPNWISAHTSESELIERMDGQRAATPPEEQTETEYERMHRVLGTQKADWMLDYANSRYESPKTSAERVRYHRLREKLAGM
jgi:hypothetical protein